MRRHPIACALAAGALMAAAPVHAMTLAEAFEAARLHDPQYRVAVHDLESSRQGVPIARAGLLPQVSLSYSNLGVSGTREFPNSLQQEVTTRVEYSSPQTSLSLRMPLFNYDAWSRLDQATAQGRGAEAAFRARGLDLVERVVIAYLQMLQARSQQSLAETDVGALTEQLRRAEQRFRRGEGTRTDEALAMSALETSRARLSDARELVDVAMARLKRLTGRQPVFALDTPTAFVPPRSQPADVRDWIEKALVQNPVLEVRQAAVDAARFGVRRNQSGHLPRLDLVGSVARARNDSLNNLDQTSFLRSVGIQLTVPLYSGGGVEASVRQAQAELSRAEEELRGERENSELEIVRQLQMADSAAQRADAMVRAVAAGEVALTGATRSQAAGQATLTEVLEARSRLQASRRDLAQAQYDHLAARMRMMLQAGEPMQRVIDQLDALLSQRIELPPTPTTAVPRS
ncbi:MAG: TolC family outer membrane protein [Rubrivivax sp.]